MKSRYLSQSSKICAFLLVLSLVACEDRASENSPAVEKMPTFESLSAPPEIEQYHSRLLADPNDFEALSALADIYFESRQFFEALQIYDKAIAVNSECADCFNDRGLALHYLGDSGRALESIDQAIALNPSLTHAWLSKGFILISIGRYQEAVAPLERVKELDTSGVLSSEADRFLATVMDNIAN